MTSVLTTVRRSLVDWGRSAAALVYPPECVCCGTALPDADDRAGSEANRMALQDDHNRFCGECRDSLRCKIEQACLSCGAPVGPHLQTWGCRHCRQDTFAFDQVVTLGVYEPPLSGVLPQVKEPMGAPLTAGLTELLCEAHEATLTAARPDLIIPVPHHWWDRVRGAHQPPVTMAGVLARQLSIPVAAHILAKRRRTPPQSSLPPARRRRNLRDAFHIAGRRRLAGASVLLTDDILTTGTTADRAARVLRQAGADRILVAVLARGLGHN